jgi:putative peptidoglycan lipid II flippase
LFSFAGRDTLTRVFFAYHDTRTPVKISVLAVALNVLVSVVLMMFMGVGGLALATTIALTVNMVVLMELLRRKLGPMGFTGLARSFARVLAASLVMGLAVWGLDSYLQPHLAEGTIALALRVGAGVLLGATVYLAAAAAVRLPELGEVWAVMKGVFKRTAPV